MSGDSAPEADGPVLVTGGAGFIGSNLVDRLASSGRDVLVFDALVRKGVESNLAWLTARHGKRIRHIHADIRDASAVEASVAVASAVFHFAAQVAVTTSLDNPRLDVDVNLGGTFALLDALRRRTVPVPIVFASTNKVYGNLSDVKLKRTAKVYVPVDANIRAHGISEERPLDFHTPYGCSKGAADQYVLDFARSFGVPGAVLRMSCIYGARQRGTEDQGWVAHFVIRALEGKKISLYGDGYQVRDILEVSDCVDAYLACWRNINEVAGQAFNLGGGPANAVSLKQVIEGIQCLVGHQIETEASEWRAGDQRYFVSDTRRAAAALGLKPPIGWKQGLEGLVRWLEHERSGISQKLEAAE